MSQGILDKNLTRMQGLASRRMQKETGKLNKQLESFEANIVERLNWIMKTQQTICDKLEIKLDDALEE